MIIVAFFAGLMLGCVGTYVLLSHKPGDAHHVSPAWLESNRYNRDGDQL